MGWGLVKGHLFDPHKMFRSSTSDRPFFKRYNKEKKFDFIAFSLSSGFAPDMRVGYGSVRVGASWKLSGRLGSSKHKLLSAILDIEYVSGSSANSQSITKHLTWVITNISVHDLLETLKLYVSRFKRRLDGGPIQGRSGYAGKIKNLIYWRN